MKQFETVTMHNSNAIFYWKQVPIPWRHVSRSTGMQVGLTIHNLLCIKKNKSAKLLQFAAFHMVSIRNNDY